MQLNETPSDVKHFRRSSLFPLLAILAMLLDISVFPSEKSIQTWFGSVMELLWLYRMGKIHRFMVVACQTGVWSVPCDWTRFQAARPTFRSGRRSVVNAVVTPLVKGMKALQGTKRFCIVSATANHLILSRVTVIQFMSYHADHDSDSTIC